MPCLVKGKHIKNNYISQRWKPEWRYVVCSLGHEVNVLTCAKIQCRGTCQELNWRKGRTGAEPGCTLAMEWERIRSIEQWLKSSVSTRRSMWGRTVAGNKAGGMEPVWWIQSRGLHPPGDSVLAFLIMHSISFVWDSPQVYVHLNGVLQFMGSQRVGHDWTELNWIIILSSILMDSWSTNYMNS